MSGLDGKLIAGKWVHAHEEDEAGALVYRRLEADLPPSRGRTELDICDDLTAVRTGPGADDRIVGKGKVQLIPENANPPSKTMACLKVREASAERLVISRE
jgi:hypothetical protein